MSGVRHPTRDRAPPSKRRPDARRPKVNGGECTLLARPDGQEKKVVAYPTLPKARKNARFAIDEGLVNRVVFVRPSGGLDEPDFREVIEA